MPVVGHIGTATGTVRIGAGVGIHGMAQAGASAGDMVAITVDGDILITDGDIRTMAIMVTDGTTAIMQTIGTGATIQTIRIHTITEEEATTTPTGQEITLPEEAIPQGQGLTPKPTRAHPEATIHIIPLREIPARRDLKRLAHQEATTLIQLRDQVRRPDLTLQVQAAVPEAAVTAVEAEAQAVEAEAVAAEEDNPKIYLCYLKIKCIGIFLNPY